jgi:hypothetical protein
LAQLFVLAVLSKAARKPSASLTASSFAPEVHEEKSRLLIQHVAMQRGHLDAVRAQRQNDRVDLVARQHEVARDGRLPAPGRLEVDTDRNAHWSDGGQWHAVLRDRITSLHVELVDASVGLSLAADNLVELRGVEVHGRRRARRRCDGQWSLAFGECIVDRSGELDRVPVPGNMHVERRRTRAQQMIVDGRDLEAVRDHLRHHRIDLGFEQHEVAHDHGAAVPRLERNPAAERQRRLDRHPVQRHGEIAAGKAVAVDVVRNGGLAAQRLVNLLPVDVLRLSRRDRAKEAGAETDEREECVSH